jgi:hypothetical protein
MAETGIKGGVELIVHIAKEAIWLIERHTTSGKLQLAQKSMDRILELFEMHSTILTQPEKENIERWINASASPSSHKRQSLTSVFGRAVLKKERLRLRNGWCLSVRRGAKKFANTMEAQQEWVQVSSQNLLNSGVS